MATSDDRVHAAVNRIMRTWSLIKNLPDKELSELRTSLMDTLFEESGLTADEGVLGLKYLHRADKGRKGGRAAWRWGVE